jgi:hypothetical protein
MFALSFDFSLRFTFLVTHVTLSLVLIASGLLLLQNSHVCVLMFYAVNVTV